MGKPGFVFIIYLLIVTPVQAADINDLPIIEGEVYNWKQTITRNRSSLYTLEYDYQITILTVDDENIEFERKITLVGGDIDLYNEISDNPDLTLYDSEIYSDFWSIDNFMDNNFGLWIPLSQEFLNEWRTQQPDRMVRTRTMTYELSWEYTSSLGSYPQFVDEIEDTRIYSKLSGLLVEKTRVVYFRNTELNTYKFSDEYQLVYQGIEVVSIYGDYIIAFLILILILVARYIRKSRQRENGSSQAYMNHN